MEIAMRPPKNRWVAFSPDACYFKPRGVPLVDLEEVHLRLDECEALRLADLLKLSQAEGGRQMGVSRATFGRILQRARRRVTEALVEGKAIRIAGGPFKLKARETILHCTACRHQWRSRQAPQEREPCPRCGNPQ